MEEKRRRTRPRRQKRTFRGKSELFVFLQVRYNDERRNHLIQATVITLWSEAELTDRESYNHQVSVQQLRRCSDVLSVDLRDDKGAQYSASSQLCQPNPDINSATMSATAITCSHLFTSSNCL